MKDAKRGRLFKNLGKTMRELMRKREEVLIARSELFDAWDGEDNQYFKDCIPIDEELDILRNTIQVLLDAQNYLIEEDDFWSPEI